MRPLPGGDAPLSNRPRSRKSSVADAAALTSSHAHVPTTFFMRKEEDMEHSVQASRDTDAVKRQKQGSFGVQNVADTLEAALAVGKYGGSGRGVGGQAHDAQSRRPVRRTSQASSRPCARDTAESGKSSLPRTHGRKMAARVASTPSTPLDADSQSPVPASAMPSTPTSPSLSSPRLSEDDETVSDEAVVQAVLSSGGDEDAMPKEPGSFPQLVMPSIQMPSRRPFTTKGKAMGKLKVLVAGRAGIGKTSLIRSIVQLCEDIVHVDPLSPHNTAPQHPSVKPKPRRRGANTSSTPYITETHASTKSYPPWWTDMEESRVLRKRKSSIDAVLERNLCFVDTPGYGAGASKAEDVSRVIDYVEDLLYQTTSVTSMVDSDLVGVISGSGGIAVDIVLYLLPPGQDISSDVDFMQRLSTFTNVVPVIAKSDTLSATELVAVKTSILARLQTTSVNPFLFGDAVDDALLAVQELSLEQKTPSLTDRAPVEPAGTHSTQPYAVSSILGPDTDTMDASLLMSPDYVQPLLPSELTALVNRVFDPESISWLRHSAAKKFLTWRRRTTLSGDSFVLQGLQQQIPRQDSVSTSAPVSVNAAAMNTSAPSSIFTPMSPSGVLVSHHSNLPSPFPFSSPSLVHSHADPLDEEAPANFSLAKYHAANASAAAHADQRLAQVRLAKWATDLQRSLRNEKERFEELQRGERAKWLLEQVGAEVKKGNIVAGPGGSPRAEWAVARCGADEGDQQRIGKERDIGAEFAGTGRARARARARGLRTGVGVDARDPLGLCDFSDEVRRKGFVLVKLLGGVSVLGAVAVAVARVCGWEGTGWWEIWGWRE